MNLKFRIDKVSVIKSKEEGIHLEGIVIDVDLTAQELIGLAKEGREAMKEMMGPVEEEKPQEESVMNFVEKMLKGKSLPDVNAGVPPFLKEILESHFGPDAMQKFKVVDTSFGPMGLGKMSIKDLLDKGEKFNPFKMD